METDTQNEANEESECMVTESPPARASARLAGRLAVGQGGVGGSLLNTASCLTIGKIQDYFLVYFMKNLRK